MDDKYRLALDASVSSTRELVGAMTEVGKAGFKEFEPEIRLLLHHPNREVMDKAIRVLAFHWQLPSFKDTCEWIWRTGFVLPEWDEEGIETARLALGAWGMYFYRSGDVDVASELYTSFRDESIHRPIRAELANCVTSVLKKSDYRFFGAMADYVEGRTSAETLEATLDELLLEWGFRLNRSDGTVRRV